MSAYEVKVWAKVPTAVGQPGEYIAVNQMTLNNTVNQVAQYSVVGTYKEYTVASKTSLGSYDKESESVSMTPSTVRTKLGNLQAYLHNRDNVFTDSGEIKHDCLLDIHILEEGKLVDSIQLPALLRTVSITTTNGNAAIKFAMSHPIAALDIFNGAVYSSLGLPSFFQDEPVLRALEESFTTVEGKTVSGRILNTVTALVNTYENYVEPIHANKGTKDSGSAALAFRRPLHNSNKKALPFLKEFLKASLDSSNLEELQFQLGARELGDKQFNKINIALSLHIANSIVATGSFLSALISNVLPSVGCAFVCNWDRKGDVSLFNAQIFPQEIAYIGKDNLGNISEPVRSFSLNASSSVILPPKRVVVQSDTVSEFFQTDDYNKILTSEGKFSDSVYPPFPQSEQAAVNHKTEIANGPAWIRGISANEYTVKSYRGTETGKRSGDLVPAETQAKVLNNKDTVNQTTNIVNNILKAWAKRMYYDRNLRIISGQIVIPLTFIYEVNRVYKFNIKLHKKDSPMAEELILEGYVNSITHNVAVGNDASTTLSFSYVRLNDFDIDQESTEELLSSKPLVEADALDITITPETVPVESET
jgi:hypothetical protein